jgi:hypothetical protein
MADFTDGWIEPVLADPVLSRKGFFADACRFYTDRFIFSFVGSIRE